MLAQGLRAIQIVLLAACAYLLYLSLSPLVGAAPIPETSVPRLDTPAQSAQDYPRYQIIADRNLFRTPDVATAAVLVEEKLEESTLKLRLIGTTAGVPASLSVATVEDERKHETSSLRVEDMVSGARVVRIERKRVVLDNRGKLEQLTLDEKARRAAPPPTRGRGRAAASRANPRATRAARAGRPRRAASRAPTRTNPVRAQREAVDLQALVSGDALDLAEDEAVTAINGIDLTDRARFQEILEVLKEPGAKTVTIQSENGATREVPLEMPETP